MDDAVRAAERRFRASGAHDDEVTWLRERLRSGELSRERCDLAAFVGHPAAAAALGLTCQGEEVCLRCYQELAVLRGLRRRSGWEASLRAVLAIARRFLRIAGTVHQAGGWPALSASLWRSRRPFEGRLLPGDWPQLRAAGERTLELGRLCALGQPLPVGEPARVVVELLHLAPVPFQLRPLRLVLAAMSDRDREVDWSSLQSDPDRTGLFAAIGAELAPWALGYEDPLRHA